LLDVRGGHMGLFGGPKKNKELESYLASCEMYMDNNYKDAAQEEFQKFKKRFKELEEYEYLSEKQLEYYDDVYSMMSEKMKGYGHVQIRRDKNAIKNKSRR
jgi:hypothetical protein